MPLIWTLPSRADHLPTPEQLAAFWQVLLAPPQESEAEAEARVLAASQSGLLEAVIPEWGRMRGPQNTQHGTHDFTLDVHTAKVVAKTTRSEYFRALSPLWQKGAAACALLHDMTKIGGLPHQKATLIPDWYHPYKSVTLARHYLPAWGFNPPQVEVLCRVITHHQLLGRVMMSHPQPEQIPPPEVLERVANWLKTPITLAVLQALSEGDIKAVRANDGLFKPDVARKLKHYGELINALLLAKQKACKRFLPFCGQTLYALPLQVFKDELPCPCGATLQEDERLYQLKAWAALSAQEKQAELVLCHLYPENILAVNNTGTTWASNPWIIELGNRACGP